MSLDLSLNLASCTKSCYPTKFFLLLKLSNNQSEETALAHNFINIFFMILQVCPTKTRQIGIQTDPLPDEFYQIIEEEKRREEEEKRRKEEEERLAREAEEKELEAAMGDSVMRYLKMVRRTSKSSDQKKAKNFRSMNYDPTLRNIKAKYLNKEEVLEGCKSMEVQVGESLLELLAKMKTPIEPPAQLPSLRKFSNRTTASELSDQSVLSPQRRDSLTGQTNSDSDFDS